MLCIHCSVIAQVYDMPDHFCTQPRLFKLSSCSIYIALFYVTASHTAYGYWAPRGDDVTLTQASLWKDQCAAREAVCHDEQPAFHCSVTASAVCEGDN